MDENSLDLRCVLRTRSKLWTAAEGSDLSSHETVRHLVNVLAGFVQPAKEVGEPGRIGVQRVGGTPTRCQIYKECLNLSGRLAIRTHHRQAKFDETHAAVARDGQLRMVRGEALD